MKFLFHTLLICLSAKTTAFNEIPLNIQYLGYAILTKSDYNLSQALFSDLLNNVKNVKKLKKGVRSNAFLLYPRLLSYYLRKQVSQTDFEQGVAFQINSLTSKTFTKLMDKESKVSTTETKGDEPVLDASASVAQTSVVERTAPGDHDTTTGVVKHTPGKRKKKAVTSKKSIKTKQNKKVPLEDEIPEVNAVTTQMSLETTVATSSQLLERSQPIQTPHVSSQKDHVVSTGTPQHEVDLSYESMFKSPSPRAITLSTPQPSTQVPSTILPLFEAIEFQKENSSSNAHITESRSQQMTVSEPIQSPILQTVEEVIPVEYYETLGGSSSGAATTTVEPIGDQLDSGYIIKTPLKSTIDVVTTVISASVGSP